MFDEKKLRGAGKCKYCIYVRDCPKFDVGERRAKVMVVQMMRTKNNVKRANKEKGTCNENWRIVR